MSSIEKKSKFNYAVFAPGIDTPIALFCTEDRANSFVLDDYQENLLVGKLFKPILYTLVTTTEVKQDVIVTN